MADQFATAKATRTVTAEAVRAAIAACTTCDDAGWLLSAEGVPLDPARPCPHGVEA